MSRECWASIGEVFDDGRRLIASEAPKGSKLAPRPAVPRSWMDGNALVWSDG